MHDEQLTTRPALRMSWVPVRDARGRVHLEARWTTTPADSLIRTRGVSRAA